MPEHRLTATLRAIMELTEAAEAKPTTQVNVLLNFFDELRRRVPAGGK